MKKSVVLSLLLLLSGCAQLPLPASSPAESNAEPEPTPITVVDDGEDFCVIDPKYADFEHQCDLVYWVNIWIQASQTSWPERKAAITKLGTSTEATVRKILLSLPVDTPYQDRLRAQHWLNTIEDKMQANMLPLIHTLVEAPNNEMLELESALVILNKVNAEQAQTNKSLQKELDSQRKKLAELLEIEATLMDKSRSTQQ